MSRPPRSWVVVVLTFVGLALIYSVATPIFEAPDESFHFFVVQHIRETGELPVQGRAGETRYAQEGSQPPLYYLVGALLTAWIDAQDATDFLRENPQANLGNPADPGNKNHFVHTDAEVFPYHGASLAVHVLRLFSIGLGLVVVVCTHATARIVFPAEPGLAVFAAAIVAFMPQFVFISASVNNDNMMNALAALAVYVLARAWRGDRSWRNELALSAVVGLATLAKLGGLILLVYTSAALLYLAWSRREWRWGVRALASVLIGAAAIGGWWYVRNLTLYGDLAGLNAMLDIVGRRALSVPELIAEVPGLWYSAWGVFGWFNLLLPDWAYTLYGLLGVVSVLGGAIGLARSRHRDARIEPIVAFMMWGVLVGGGVLRWTAMTPGSQGRLMFPAITALAILAAVGLRQWARGRRRAIGAGSIGLAMFAVAAWVPFGVLRPTYARPERIALGDVPASVTPLNLDFNHTIRLVGGAVEPRDARPGDTIVVTLYWQALANPDREYMVALEVLGREWELVGKEDAYHGAGTYPSDLWQAGEVLHDRYQVRLADPARTPTRARVALRLRDRSAQQPVLITTANGDPFEGLIVVGELRLSPTEPVGEPQVALGYRLGDAIELIGYDSSWVDAGTIVYRLYWRAIDTPRQDYTVFVHQLDGRGEIVAQWDSPPFDGDYPTSWWRAGEMFVEERRIPLTSGNGTRIALGLYRAPDGPRLPVYDAGGARLPDDRVLIEIAP